MSPKVYSHRYIITLVQYYNKLKYIFICPRLVAIGYEHYVVIAMVMVVCKVLLSLTLLLSSYTLEQCKH